MLGDIWLWLTDLGNSKMLALLIFFPTFVGIIIYVYTNKNRSKRLESYKYIPFQDDEESLRDGPTHKKGGN
jgi:cbb3-type cytochrome oxidase subunit 3